MFDYIIRLLGYVLRFILRFIAEKFIAEKLILLLVIWTLVMMLIVGYFIAIV